MTRFGRVWRRDNLGYPVGRVPGTRVALLSRPEKMPGASWALPAGPSCPFAVYGENAICSGCYANGGRQRDDIHTRAYWARFDWARECMKTPEGVDQFVAVMVRAIDRTNRRFFRIHDAGDFFSPEYVRAWFRICEALSWVHFWAPTRSWRAPWVAELVRLNTLPNVAVRPSALYFDGEPPQIEGLSAGTTARAIGHDCPAARNNGRCGDCRRCWLEKTRTIGYHRIRGSGKKARPRPVELLELVKMEPTQRVPKPPVEYVEKIPRPRQEHVEHACTCGKSVRGNLAVYNHRTACSGSYTCADHVHKAQAVA